MKKLFERGYIGSCQIKNRIVMLPMTPGFAGKDGQTTEQQIQYYEERAKGGVGLIITEIFCVDPKHGVATARQLNALDRSNISVLARFTTRIHKYGTKIFAQLQHGGSTNSPLLNHGRIVAPSAISNAGGPVPDALTLEEIDELKRNFVTSAVHCQAAEFDGVELHGGHGYLLTQFMSAAFNKRTDQYGGSLENRCRIVTELVQEIKAACGKNFPVSVRFSVNEYDYVHPDSIKLEEGVEIAKLIEIAGADAVNVSCGNKCSKYGESMEPYSYEQGWRRQNAESVKAVVSIPVISNNTIKTPEFAESLLENGVCDFIGLGRAVLADPQWVRKAREGHSDEVRKCLGCLHCFDSLIKVGHIRCAVNPRLGREECFTQPPEANGNGRKIAVVGGGPAGLQAAIVLGQRGFDVTLYEKSSEVGGALNLADKTAPYKNKITMFRDTLFKEAQAAGVKILLNSEATPELVAKGQPEAVFVAVGSRPVHPSCIPGVDRPNVVQAQDIIIGKVSVSGRIVIVGGGLTGLETGAMLCQSGKVEHLYIADMVSQIGAGIFVRVFNDVMAHMEGHPVDLLPAHRLVSIDEDGVCFSKADGTEYDIPADYIVLSLGVSPLREEITRYEEVFQRVVPVGDVLQIGQIGEAVRSGYTAAYGFDPCY